MKIASRTTAHRHFTAKEKGQRAIGTQHRIGAKRGNNFRNICDGPQCGCHHDTGRQYYSHSAARIAGKPHGSFERHATESHQPRYTPLPGYRVKID